MEQQQQEQEGHSPHATNCQIHLHAKYKIQKHICMKKEIYNHIILCIRYVSWRPPQVKGAGYCSNPTWLPTFIFPNHSLLSQPTHYGLLECSFLMRKTSTELRMLSSVTINCQVRMIDCIQVLNCQNCNQCLKCQVSRTVFPIVKNCLNVIKNCHKTSQEL